MDKKVIRFIFSITAASMMAIPVCGQSAHKKVRMDIDKAKTYIKSGKDFDKAEKLMTELLKDSANHDNIKIYATWFESVLNQYNAANEKLYLKQKYDTAAFYNLTRHLQEVAVELDALDTRPDNKGRVRPSYRSENAELLNALRINIYYGGTWWVRKGDYEKGYTYFDDYLEAVRLPLYEAYHYQRSDSRLTTAAYWATLCGYRLHDAERTLKYSQLALGDSSKATYTLQYMCEAYQWQKNDSAYIKTLSEGYERFPEYPYFFPRLADFYAAQGKYDKVLSLANRGLDISPNNTLFLLARSVALLNLEQYDECIETSRTLMELNDSLPEPYFNIATCYLNRALTIEQEREPRKNRLRLQKLYSEARPFMEDYRRMAPDDKKRWAPALYRIYLNLNLGKQFEEIDRLMRK
jgi:hypothetical protein